MPFGDFPLTSLSFLSKLPYFLVPLFTSNYLGGRLIENCPCSTLCTIETLNAYEYP